MDGASALFSSATANWSTPRHVYAGLHQEFAFTLDPCGLGDEGGLFARYDGLLLEWAGQRIFCNPPYGPDIDRWLARCHEPDLAVYLLPVRTDTRWFHRWCLPLAAEIRFLKGRLRFGAAKAGAPFPSMLVVYRKVR
jgi:site-specific DNA-methyltransferase (adenine-specific)